MKNLKGLVAELAGKGADAYGSAKKAGSEMLQGAMASGTPNPTGLATPMQAMGANIAQGASKPAAMLGGGALAGGAVGGAIGNAAGQQEAMMAQEEMMAAEQQQKVQMALQEMGKRATFDPTTQSASIKKADIDAALKTVMGEAGVPPLSPQDYIDIAAMGNMTFAG